MLFNLALRNVRRQASSYLIYFITVTLTVAFLFALNNMVFGEVLRRLHPAYESIVRPLLVALSAVLGAVIAFVLAYATAFLLRRRKKEFGLYLTMGMTRGNILALFAGETAVTFLCSLAAGVLLGLGLYQLLLYAFMQFIDGTYQAGGYAAGGILWTVLLVALIFLLASAASLGYLRFAKISALLAGEKKGEKKVRFPWLWPLLAAASLAAGIFACVRFVGWIGSSDFSDRVDEAVAYIALLLAALLLFPASLCQSGAWLLQRRDCCAANGLGRVTLRHISARLGGSSLLIGLLSILLAISLIGPNVFLASRALEERQVQVDQAFDVVAVHTEKFQRVFNLFAVRGAERKFQTDIVLHFLVVHVAGILRHEIDSGVSGNMAQMVAQKLASAARGKQGYQCIVITHLPQIAAMSDRIVRVEKRLCDGRTETFAQALEGNGRIEEVARLMGGVGQHALVNAEELVQHSEKYKSTLE